MQEEEDED
jgi:hypothetical protein